VIPSALHPVRVHGAAIAGARFLLVCCLRNEAPRLAAFLAHYRALGVDHFLVIDNVSTDGGPERVLAEPDCSLWRAPGSYRAAAFGMDWCHRLLDAHGRGKWCLTVDLDEFLVHPHAGERGLPGLTRHMDKIGQPALFTVLLDCYGPGRLSDTPLADGADPRQVCPCFDRFNFTQRLGKHRDHLWVQGGVRQRRFFADAPDEAPALNKLPLVRWERGLRYVSSTHFLNRPGHNLFLSGHPEAVSGVLLHYKFVAGLIDKSAEEVQRREHYAGAAEYRSYAMRGDVVLHDPQVSLRYDGPAQLERLGFMQRGTWF